MGALWSSCTIKVRPLFSTNFWKGMSMSALGAKVLPAMSAKTRISPAALNFIGKPSHPDLQQLFTRKRCRNTTTGDIDAYDARKSPSELRLVPQMKCAHRFDSMTSECTPQ